MKVNKVLILVELGNGHVHQVLASKEHKDMAVHLLRNADGVLRLSERVEPILVEKYVP